jgi:hypothetical protein
MLGRSHGYTPRRSDEQETRRLHAMRVSTPEMKEYRPRLINKVCIGYQSCAPTSHLPEKSLRLSYL